MATTFAYELRTSHATSLEYRNQVLWFMQAREYHASQTDEQRLATHREFLDDEIEVVVATSTYSIICVRASSIETDDTTNTSCIRHGYRQTKRAASDSLRSSRHDRGILSASGSCWSRWTTGQVPAILLTDRPRTQGLLGSPLGFILGPTLIVVFLATEHLGSTRSSHQDVCGWSADSDFRITSY